VLSILLNLNIENEQVLSILLNLNIENEHKRKKTLFSCNLCMAKSCKI